MKDKAIYESGGHNAFGAIHIHTRPMFVVGELIKGVEISSSTHALYVNTLHWSPPLSEV